MSIVVLPENHSAWLNERRYGIGASDAASILGMSKWKSNVALWEEKVGLREPDDISDKPYVKYGHNAEPHLRALFSLDHPDLQVTYESPYKIIRNSEHPFIFCTPDGELLERESGRRGGLEIKTTEIVRATQWREWKNKIPDQYYCQTIWQMIAAEWDFVWVRAQIKYRNKDGQLEITIKDYPIERADVEEDIEYTMKAGIEFWQKVEKKQRPALLLPRI